MIRLFTQWYSFSKRAQCDIKQLKMICFNYACCTVEENLFKFPTTILHIPLILTKTVSEYWPEKGWGQQT